MKIKAPCKDCENRYVGCHDRCKKYQEYKKQSDEERENAHALKAEEMKILDSIIAGGKRMKNRRASNRFRK